MSELAIEPVDPYDDEVDVRLLQQERPDIERVITWNGEEQQPHGAGQRRAGVSGRGSDG